MSRVKSGVTSRANHKKVIKQAKGYYGRRKNVFRVATQAVDKAGQYAIATGGGASAASGRCGSSASTPPAAPRG
jgi:hypothetical protein